jgi:hypothetical protein
MDRTHTRKRIAAMVAIVLAATLAVACSGSPPRATTTSTAASSATGLIAPSSPAESAVVPTDLPKRAAMETVVEMVKAGKFQTGEGQLGFDYRADLPAEFADLSLGGSISIITNTKTKALSVIFYAVLPGGPDHYSGWVWRSSGELSSDPQAGGEATINRIDANWFWVVAY